MSAGRKKDYEQGYIRIRHFQLRTFLVQQEAIATI